MRDLNENWNNVLPITLEYDELYTNYTISQQLQISKKIRKFYVQDRAIEENSRQQLTNMYSDRFFNHGVRKNALLMAEYVPVYVYQFAHNRGDFSGVQFFGIDKNFGKLNFINKFHLVPLPANRNKNQKAALVNFLHRCNRFYADCVCNKNVIFIQNSITTTNNCSQRKIFLVEHFEQLKQKLLTSLRDTLFTLCDQFNS